MRDGRSVMGPDVARERKNVCDACANNMCMLCIGENCDCSHPNLNR